MAPTATAIGPQTQYPVASKPSNTHLFFPGVLRGHGTTRRVSLKFKNSGELVPAMLLRAVRIAVSRYLLRTCGIGAASLLVLTMVSGCASQGNEEDMDASTGNTSEFQPDNSSPAEVEDTVSEYSPAAADEPDLAKLAYAGSKEVVTHYDGYTFKYGWDWKLGDATSDVQNSRPGETEVTVTNEGEATIENTTLDRTMDFGRGWISVYGYYEDSSAICEALSTDDEVPGCWLKLGNAAFVDGDNVVAQGGFSLDDGEVFTGDFSVPDILNNNGVATQTYHGVDEDLAEEFVSDVYEPKYVGMFTSMSIAGDDIEFDTPATSDLCTTLLGGRGSDDLLLIGSNPELSCDEMYDIDDSAVG